jgi:hypothetical protein
VAIRPSPVDMRSNLDVFGMLPSVGSAGRRLAVGWGTGARTVGSGGGSSPFGLGLSPAPMATSPAAPPKIPYGGFSPVRLKVPGTAQFSGESSPHGGRLKCDPHIHRPPRELALAFGITSAESVSRLGVRADDLKRSHLDPEVLAPVGFSSLHLHRLATSSAGLIPSGPFPGTAGYRHGL